MSLQIITQPFELDIYGFQGFARDKNFSGTAFRLMDRMWQVVKSNGVKNKGRNIWVYGEDNGVFAGVELEEIPASEIALERMHLFLPKYAYYKHIGPYPLIPESGRRMRDEILRKGLQSVLPYIEIYGHWSSDESQLETELLMCLR